jgi:hypothetical protein
MRNFQTTEFELDLHDFANCPKESEERDQTIIDFFEKHTKVVAYVLSAVIGAGILSQSDVIGLLGKIKMRYHETHGKQENEQFDLAVDEVIDIIEEGVDDEAGGDRATRKYKAKISLW